MLRAQALVELDSSQPKLDKAAEGVLLGHVFHAAELESVQGLDGAVFEQPCNAVDVVWALLGHLLAVVAFVPVHWVE